MPSGAKKRKAARKKKEKENNNNNNHNNPSSTNNPPQGNDELKSQDDKGSDGGGGNSPAYHEHGDHHDPFNGGSEEVEARDPPAARPFASDVKSIEEVPGDVKIEHVLGGKEDSVVMIEKDLQSEESYKRKDASFEHKETAKESCYESGKAGGTSNGESVVQVSGGKENSVVTLERDLKSDESCEGKNVSFEHIEVANKESCYESGNGGGTSNGESLAEKNSKYENFNSLEEATACHELVKSVDSSPPGLSSILKSAPAEVEEASGDSAAEYSINSVKAAASASEVENSDAGSVLLEKSVVPPLEKTNLAVKTNNDNVYSLTDENVRTSSLEEPKPKEYDSKALTSSSASPLAKLTNGAEHYKNSETPECSENQPRVTSAPNMVQKTSWWNCCGLFEVLSGSNR